MEIESIAIDTRGTGAENIGLWFDEKRKQLRVTLLKDGERWPDGEGIYVFPVPKDEPRLVLFLRNQDFPPATGWKAEAQELQVVG